MAAVSSPSFRRFLWSFLSSVFLHLPERNMNQTGTCCVDKINELSATQYIVFDNRTEDSEDILYEVHFIQKFCPGVCLATHKDQSLVN